MSVPIYATDILKSVPLPVGEERGIPVADSKSRSSKSGKKNVRQKMIRVMYGNLD